MYQLLTFKILVFFFVLKITYPKMLDLRSFSRLQTKPVVWHCFNWNVDVNIYLLSYNPQIWKVLNLDISFANSLQLHKPVNWSVLFNSYKDVNKLNLHDYESYFPKKDIFGTSTAQ